MVRAWLVESGVGMGSKRPAGVQGPAGQEVGGWWLAGVIPGMEPVCVWMSVENDPQLLCF